MKSSVKGLVEYFEVERAWDIPWAHAVNNGAFLRACIRDPAVMMLEGDILEVDGRIIMAHPPERGSDIDFDRWIRSIVESGKGAKLDFKYSPSYSCIERCLEMALEAGAEKIPLFLNADVVSRPGGTCPVYDGAEFIERCRHSFPQAMLSLGFEVDGGPDPAVSLAAAEGMLDEALDLASAWDGETTICLCSSFLMQTYGIVSARLFPTGHSMTLWNFEPVTQDLARWIHAAFPKEKTFYDFKDSAGLPHRI